MTTLPVLAMPSCAVERGGSLCEQQPRISWRADMRRSCCASTPPVHSADTEGLGLRSWRSQVYTNDGGVRLDTHYTLET